MDTVGGVVSSRFLTVLNAVAQRFDRYRAADISRDICESDGMLARGAPGALDHYFAVGRSAIEITARAMIAAGRTEFGSVLDLPCGGGRVTRHLACFFPEAALFVGELDKLNEAFVAETFRAARVAPGAGFGMPPERTFDLIFVGSLLTHLDADKFATAVDWFIRALADDGILVLTTHGRRADHCERVFNRYIGPALWGPVLDLHARTGFGYVETEQTEAGSYGFSLSAPSWIMRLLEREPSVHIIGFHEGAWDQNQDVLALQKRSIDWERTV
jgi:SAM-dependent methyltransferase